MIHRYKIIVDKGKDICFESDMDNVTFKSNCSVSWEKNGQNNIETIFIEISGKDINFSEDGAILTCYPEIDATAYNISVFLSDNIFIQTSIEAFEPIIVLSNSPEVIPETKEEEAILKANKKRKHLSVNIAYDIQGKFRPENCTKYIESSSAIAHYANALRQHEPSIKFEQFYKVVEAIFKKGKKEDSGKFDRRVSGHVSTIDSRYTISLLERLRQIRNRCVHPNAHLGHLSPDDLVALREIKGSLQAMQLLAKLSIDDPPK